VVGQIAELDVIVEASELGHEHACLVDVAAVLANEVEQLLVVHDPPPPFAASAPPIETGKPSDEATATSTSSLTVGFDASTSCTDLADTPASAASSSWRNPRSRRRARITRPHVALDSARSCTFETLEGSGSAVNGHSCTIVQNGT